jgi:hypothetical protein
MLIRVLTSHWVPELHGAIVNAERTRDVYGDCYIVHDSMGHLNFRGHCIAADSAEPALRPSLPPFAL